MPEQAAPVIVKVGPIERQEESVSILENCSTKGCLVSKAGGTDLLIRVEVPGANFALGENKGFRYATENRAWSSKAGDEKP